MVAWSLRLALVARPLLNRAGILQVAKEISVFIFKFVDGIDVKVSPKKVFSIGDSKHVEVKFPRYPPAYLTQCT